MDPSPWGACLIGYVPCYGILFHQTKVVFLNEGKIQPKPIAPNMWCGMVCVALSFPLPMILSHWIRKRKCSSSLSWPQFGTLCLLYFFLTGLDADSKVWGDGVSIAKDRRLLRLGKVFSHHTNPHTLTRPHKEGGWKKARISNIKHDLLLLVSPGPFPSGQSLFSLLTRHIVGRVEQDPCVSDLSGPQYIQVAKTALCMGSNIPTKHGFTFNRSLSGPLTSLLPYTFINATFIQTQTHSIHTHTNNQCGSALRRYFLFERAIRHRLHG